MKKMLSIVCAVCMCYAVNAQDDKQDKKITFGLRAGVNFANVSGNGSDILLNSNPDTRVGLTIGGLVAYKINDAFSLQGELAYGQQGFYEKISGDYEATIKLNYINLPILAKYYLAEGFSVEAGPQLGFLVAARFEEKDLEDNDEYDEDIKEYFKSTDFGVNVGLGYQLENGIGISARYILGITDIFDYSRRSNNVTKQLKDEEIIRDNYELKNKVFQLTIFYTF